MFSVLYILILPLFRIVVVGVNVLSSSVLCGVCYLLHCYASTRIKGRSEIIIVNCLPPQLPANKFWRLWKLLVHFISKSNIWNNTVHSRQFWSSEAWDPGRQRRDKRPESCNVNGYRIIIFITAGVNLIHCPHCPVATLRSPGLNEDSANVHSIGFHERKNFLWPPSCQPHDISHVACDTCVCGVSLSPWQVTTIS